MGRKWAGKTAHNGEHVLPPPCAVWSGHRRSSNEWPAKLKNCQVARGIEFTCHVEDPLDWHRTGRYRYVVAGWDAARGQYEAWEATGLHTRYFSEEELGECIAGWTSGAHTEGRDVAHWASGELREFAEIDWHSGAASVGSRDRVFDTQLSGWKPYGTLEMAGPMLFQLHAQRLREPQRFQSVCDIGAGHGRMSHWLSQAWGFEAIALDIEAPNYPEYDPIVIFDGRKLPLEDKSVDCAVFSFVLHHCRHFEIQRALLREAARVTRRWILIAEDTPITEKHWKATRGHDSQGTFQSLESWLLNFSKLKLQLIRKGPLWEGPKNGPSPYLCSRHYFILEVPIWLQPPPALSGLPGLAACGCTGKSLCSDNNRAAENVQPNVVDDEARADISHRVADFRSAWLVQEEKLDVEQTQSIAEQRHVIDDIPCNILTSFLELRLPEWLSQSLAAQNFVTPTPIQSEVIPVILAGVDIVGVAKTGSGKTLAYLLPSVLRLVSEGANSRPFILILAPTRELVIQIATCAEALLARTGKRSKRYDGLDTESVEEHQPISVAALWGGGPRWEQLKKLRDGAEIIAATPGRLLDLVCEEEDEGRTFLDTVRLLILDEGDRMLSEGMGDQLDAVSLRTSRQRQTLFFSATWPAEVGVLAAKFCRGDPLILQVGKENESKTGLSGNYNIVQRVEVFDDNESEVERETRKFKRLLDLLDAVLGNGNGEMTNRTDAGGLIPVKDIHLGGKALVFCMTKKFADELVSKLEQSGWPATAVHGNKTQTERLHNLDAFARGQSRVLVATDVLGRGLDIPQVTHVFIYDFACSLEEYAHRIGRTARGINGKGEAIAFFEYAPALPSLALELVEYLQQMQQDVPDALRRIAEEAASGKRFQSQRCGVNQSKSTNVGESDEKWLALARPHELGAWDSGGHRSWMLAQEGSSEADGWFVLCSGGHLQTHAGDGTWELNSLGRLLVVFASVCYELQLHKRWGGAKRDHFVSVGCRPSVQATTQTNAPLYSILTGWVTRSKVYKYKTESHSIE